jgi:lysine 2,3-aminomutase
MVIFDERQQEIARRLQQEAELTHWKNWRWQLQNTIEDLDSFEKLLGITFDKTEKAQLQKTVEKFPLSITPYYLSLIDASDYRNDPYTSRPSPPYRNYWWEIMK